MLCSSSRKFQGEHVSNCFKKHGNQHILVLSNTYLEPQMTTVLIGKDLVLEGPRLRIEEQTGSRYYLMHILDIGFQILDSKFHSPIFVPFQPPHTFLDGGAIGATQKNMVLGTRFFLVLFPAAALFGLRKTKKN